MITIPSHCHFYHLRKSFQTNIRRDLQYAPDVYKRQLNHNELLTYPNSYDQVMFGTVKAVSYTHLEYDKQKRYSQ